MTKVGLKSLKQTKRWVETLLQRRGERGELGQVLPSSWERKPPCSKEHDSEVPEEEQSLDLVVV